ncbi:MAG TPA: SDR family oxidoreductase [Anaerolineae bacterium]|nr:SDR family oxidoreductase [Anaerolineae bacterium]
MPDRRSPPFNPAGRVFLVTGGAGFIGSHIVRRLVAGGAQVRVLDVFSTGRRENLADVMDRIELIKGDIADMATVRRAVAGVEYVLHLAALVSVPESIDHPERNLAVNVVGTHNLLLAARDAAVHRVVFSSSCAVYGEHTSLLHEELTPWPLSPYAAAKLSGEQLCRTFTHVYGLPTVCLRYFNVFGPSQNAQGTYANVIPRFITAMLGGKQPVIYGDGHQSRDFVYVANVVEANLLACSAQAAIGSVFNIGTGRETSLLELLAMLREIMELKAQPVFAPPRAGDIARSHGDISLARAVLAYQPTVDLVEGLRQTVVWYDKRVIGSRAQVRAQPLSGRIRKMPQSV